MNSTPEPFPKRRLCEVKHAIVTLNNETELAAYGFVYARRVYAKLDPHGASEYCWRLLSNGKETEMIRLGLLVATEYRRRGAHGVRALLAALAPALDSYCSVAAAAHAYYQNDQPMREYVRVALLENRSPTHCRRFLHAAQRQSTL